MDNIESQPASEYYRSCARQMLTLAGNSMFDDTHEMLVQLALEYQKLSVSAAAFERLRRDVEPSN